MLQSLQLTTPPLHPPAPEPQPMSSNMNLPTANLRLSCPEKFDGSPDKCKGFLFTMLSEPLAFLQAKNALVGTRPKTI